MQPTIDLLAAGRSSREFYAKLCIAVEELDESILWLEFTKELELAKTEQIRPIVNEMKELLAILTTSKSTLNQKLFPDK